MIPTPTIPPLFYMGVVHRHFFTVSVPVACPASPESVHVPLPLVESSTICRFMPFGRANTASIASFCSQASTAAVKVPNVIDSRFTCTVNDSANAGDPYQCALSMAPVPCQRSGAGAGGVGDGPGAGVGAGAGGVGGGAGWPVCV